MHNRIEKIFEERKGNILSVYFTAGFPGLEDTPDIIKTLNASGADMIEVGMPFSDPVADGPTIQQSNKIALDNGITLHKILEQVRQVRDEIDIPVILMGYLNPVYQYGTEKFCEDCEKAGVSAVILPDLPIDEYLAEYKNIFEMHGLFNIFLITPETSESRLRRIDSISRGFIYMVSASSTTGSRKGLSNEQLTYFRRIRDLNLKTPRMIGFGISDHESYRQAVTYADGAIIGSAFIKVLLQSNNIRDDINKFIRSIKGTKN